MFSHVDPGHLSFAFYHGGRAVNSARDAAERTLCMAGGIGRCGACFSKRVHLAGTNADRTDIACLAAASSFPNACILSRGWHFVAAGDQHCRADVIDPADCRNATGLQ